MREDFDVAVIGGGPAGSTAAAFLAGGGARVSVFEREQFPRFHIGESLLPFNMDIFARLGIRDQLEENFIQKWGAEFISGDGEAHEVFHFENGLIPGRPMCYQVLRSRFDQMLLDTADARGAEIYQGHSVLSAVPSSRTGARLRVRDLTGNESEIHARFILDASGRDSMLGSRMGVRRMNRHLRKVALFAHFENVPRSPGRDEGNIVLILMSDGWFWFIPLKGAITSIGLVLNGRRLKESGLQPEEAFEAAVASCPAAEKRLRQARRVSPVMAASDWSYRCRRLRGDGYLLVGDAASFVDPIFSSGVYLAMSSGELAAKALLEALENHDLSPRSFRGYERAVRRQVDMYTGLAQRFYQPGFTDVCLSPGKRLRLTPAVISLLAGCVERRWPLRWRLALFYSIVRLQRFIPLAPRQNLRPVFEPPSRSPVDGGATRTA
ncbi:MAG: NAD(P)/FAD-dependent oxidoreductase [Acidobacteria bacterium]|nr:NAD(P)/FAD-dependent oxidoreductase [Acidobacteriota bacterium]